MEPSSRFTMGLEDIQFDVSSTSPESPESFLLTALSIADQADNLKTRVAAMRQLLRSVTIRSAPDKKLGPAISPSPIKKRKMLEFRKSVTKTPKRSPGQVWRGASGRQFTMNEDRRVVPYKGPQQQTGGKPKAGQDEAVQQQNIEAKKNVIQQLMKVAGNVGEKADKIWQKLKAGSMRKMSPEARKKLRIVAKYAAAVEHQLEKFTSSTQHMVHEIVKESGMDQEDQELVMNTVKGFDFAFRWTANIPYAKAAMTVTGVATGGAGFLLSKVGYYIPVASLAYIAGSTAVDPMSTIRAAKNLLKGKDKKNQENSEIDEAFVSGFVELCKRYGTDLVAAVVSVAIDQTHDAHEALAAAEEALEQRGTQFPKVNGSPFKDRSKSFWSIQTKEGFTGRREDKLGRQRCYANGRLVPCHAEVKPSPVKPKQDNPKERIQVGPSKPDDRRDVKPPILPDKFVPPEPMGTSRAPKNAEGRPTTGYTASGMTNTSFGDMVEALTSQLGMRSILPEGKRSNQKVETEGSSIDVEYDHSGYAFEIKAVCVEAQEYKAGPKKDEIEGKFRYAKMHDLKPSIMVVVVDVWKGEGHAYWQEMVDPERASYKLRPDKLEEWNYAGKITFQPPEKPEHLKERT